MVLISIIYTGGWHALASPSYQSVSSIGVLERCMERVDGQRDPVEDLARAARIVILAEEAYDITDTLASRPSSYEEQLALLARLAVKVYKDLESFYNKGEGERVEEALKRLKYMAANLEKLFRYLRCVEAEGGEKLLNREVRRLAALSLAPDYHALSVREILWG